MPLCNPSDYIRYPTTIDDVVAIVQEAISRGVKVKAFGARHSQTDIICTEGIPIDNHGLTFYQLNEDGTATFGAGVTLHDATEFLRNNGRAFRTTPAFGNITMAGAIGTGAHGSSIKYTSSISSQVVGVTVVDGLGNVQNVTNESDLHAFRIHLGLLGIVVRITLTTHPLYKTLAHNYIVSDSVLINGTAQQWALEADQMSLYWFPSMNQVVVANWTIVDPNTTGNAYTFDHVPSTYDNFNILGSQVFEESAVLTQNRCSAVRQLGFNTISILQSYMQTTLWTTVPDFVPIYTEDGVTVVNPAVGYYDKMFAPVCNDGPGNGPLQCAWGHGNVHANITILDNEISLDLNDMPQFILAVKDILSKAPALFPIQGILMRFSASSDTYMSNSYGRNSVHFEWYLANRVDMYQDAVPSLAAYQTMMQTLVFINAYLIRNY